MNEARPVRTLAGFTTLTALVFVLSLGFAHAAAPPNTPEEGGVAWRINHERWLRKIHTLVVSESVSEKARTHSCQMAKDQALSHDANISAMIDDKDWKLAGENVGDGWDLYSMHVQWMQSPEHRDNILDWRFNKMGVGVCKDAGGTYWATVVFYG